MGVRVLVTGSGGSIGRVATAALRAAGHHVRGFDCSAAGGAADEAVVGRLEDAAAVDRAVAGRDAVVHLAAYPNDAPFVDTLLGPNVLGLYHVMDACGRAGVKRVVLASTLQVISGHRQAGRAVTVADGAAPVNHYALTKQWAEDLGAMYARVHPVEVIAARIGWFLRDAGELRRMMAHEGYRRAYLSHGDAGRFFAHAVDCPLRQAFNLVFLVGRHDGGGGASLAEARDLLGFEPRDAFPAGVPEEWLREAGVREDATSRGAK